MHVPPVEQEHPGPGITIMYTIWDLAHGKAIMHVHNCVHDSYTRSRMFLFNRWYGIRVTDHVCIQLRQLTNGIHVHVTD